MLSNYTRLFNDGNIPEDNSANLRPANYSPNNYARKLSKLLNLQNNDYLLDVGCGNALTARALSKYVGKIYLVDGNERIVASLQKQTFKKVEGIACHESSNMLSLKDNIFTKVICIAVLQYCTEEEAKKSVREFLRVCKKGGIVYLGDMLKQEAGFPQVDETMSFDPKVLAQGHKFTIRKSFFEPEKRYDLIIKKCGT